MMPRFSGKQATIFAIIILLLTVSLGYLFSSYEIVVSGLLVTIFFTVFIAGKRATVFAGGTAIVILTVMVLLLNPGEATIRVLTEHVFSLLLVIFTILLVLYLKQLQRHLDFERQHMSSLFENATEGILLTNRKGNMILVNPAAEKMFGYDADELIGHNIDQLIPKRIRKSHETLREKFHEAPSNRSMGSGRDLFAVRKDGTEFPVEVSLSHYQEGNETFVIAFVVDITQRKIAEQELLRQKEELEKISHDIRQLNTALEDKVEERTRILKEALEKLEASQQELSEALAKEKELGEMKSRFVSMASHEFRTPLSTILSSASLLSRYTTTEDQEKREKHIDRIKSSVRHLNDILEDLLSVGRLEEGKTKAEYEWFDLHQLLEETVTEAKLLAKKGQQIRFDYRGTKEAEMDKRKTRVILTNLLSNAIKFSPEEQEILISAEMGQDDFTLVVQDHGIGIAEEDKEHLFTTFFRAGNVQNIQGTGLGLHIVGRFIGLMQGSITLDSRLGQGTTVTVKLPVRKN